jgi:glycosyltransferase involved in cell wall biosynthesis
MDTTTQKPLVSINICTFNRANLISKAIKSALAQTYTNKEIIVLDDASTDNTEEVVRDFMAKNPNIFYYKNPENLGITKNRNNGLQKSNGKYIAVLDSDDYWIDENKLSEQIEFLENNSDYGLIGTFSKIVDMQENEIGKLSPKIEDFEIRKKILSENQFINSSVVFLKKSLSEYAVEDFSPVEDFAAHLEIGKKYKFANLPKFYTAYRQHQNNISKTQKKKGIVALEKIIKKYKNDYPNFWLAFFKNKIRFLRSVF